MVYVRVCASVVVVHLDSLTVVCDADCAEQRALCVLTLTLCCVLFVLFLILTTWLVQ